MTGKKVSAAIVTYNRLDLLKESLGAVLGQTKYLNHVIVINNKSNDGTKEYLSSLKDERLVVFNSEDNLGGAGGFNQAVRLFAEKTDDDYVWLMDDDTIVQPDALEHLVDFVEEHDHVGFVNSQVRWGSLEGNPSWMNVPAPRGFTWQMYMTPKNPAVEVVNSTFVSVMFSRKMVAMIGLPQKEYFIWGDDMEYTNRIADVDRGYTVLKSIAVHKSKENSMPGDIVKEKDESRLWRYDFEFRNRVLTARRISKHEYMHTVINGFRFDLRFVLFNKNVKFRFTKAKMIIRGIFKGIFFNPEIEYAEGLTRIPKRSINALFKARYLTMPNEIFTLDDDVKVINESKLTDFKGHTVAADKFIEQQMGDFRQ